jgi:hypothetical protein
MRRACLLSLVLSLGIATEARAGDDVSEAREQFRRGAELAKDAQWSAALAAFERSSKLRSHPWTTYNMAVCERALGHYVRARRTFDRALAERGPGSDLPESTVLDIERFTAEIDRLTATLDLTIDPPDARVAVDGQPLEAAGTDGGVPLVFAGTLPPGPGRALPAPRVRLVVDPGHHVFVLGREGFGDAVHTESVRPGERRAVSLSIERLPATIRIDSNVTRAVVTVDSLDVGVAPVTLRRPAGAYRVVVRKPGFLPYETQAVVSPGQRADLVATLREERPSVFSRWWFWTAAGVVVTGAAITTYAVTRPEPGRPPVDGGGLGWVVRAP